MSKATFVALLSKLCTGFATLWALGVEDDEDGAVSRRTTCAFCLRTSAGVRIKHETSSATEEEMELRMGRGRRGVGLFDEGEGMEDKRDLVAS